MLLISQFLHLLWELRRWICPVGSTKGNLWIDEFSICVSDPKGGPSPCMLQAIWSFYHAVYQIRELRFTLRILSRSMTPRIRL
jgi:hypothetical protein